MSRPICAQINLSALRQNLQQVRLLAPNSKIWAVIKANGYGHGVERVASQFTSADGFAVASIDEALLLRQKGFIHRILLLEGVFNADEIKLVEQHHLDMVVHSVHQMNWLLDSNVQSPLNIWLKLDTGMHRLGFSAEAFMQALTKLRHSQSKHQFHCISHFASADESEDFSQHQLAQFNHVTSALDYVKSFANSAAIQLYSASHFDWVRPGIMLYGAGVLPAYRERFRAALSFSTRLISLKWIDAGEGVGYGQTWIAERKTLLGVAAAGYGDGYPRHAPSGTPVLVNGQRAALVGRVSMDMITIDLTDMASNVKIGDPVLLWGEQLSVDEVAAAAGTIGYELLCGITQRVPIKELSDD